MAKQQYTIKAICFIFIYSKGHLSSIL